MDFEIFSFKTPWPPCQVVPLPPKAQFGHWVWQQSSCGWEAQGSTSTSTADVVSSASYRSSSILSLEITDEILWPGIVTQPAAWASFSSVSITNTSSQARLHVVIFQCRVLLLISFSLNCLNRPDSLHHPIIPGIR